jgi:hypothetical protein
MVSNRGGDHGGGTTIRHLELQSETAARELRRRATGAHGGMRYRKADANAAATELLEQAADHRLLYLTSDMLAALPWLQEARQMCESEDAQRGLDQLIAALWTAKARQQDLPRASGAAQREITMTSRMNRARYGITLYRVKTTGGELRSGYDQVSDAWEDTETENEFRVPVVDQAGFEQLAEDDPAIVSYRVL